MFSIILSDPSIPLHEQAPLLNGLWEKENFGPFTLDIYIVP